ncbi:tripartite tricarboxylate transporter TctB family protein [Aquabacter cavernae]|uniref:tripartite tricarboxylate transporter TctB family protein n=1 Tax=Aquabacter cavernae TaxID=2496029 RepID=UPI000F8F1688|nr:tripartite tricarboxylate transporter TctB family protein [Aquabacter cavernae]
MNPAIRNTRYFCIGLIYVASGLLFLALSSQYQFGTLSKMGPGYLPTVLAILLTGVGIVSLVLSFFLDGAPLPRPNVRALVLILLAVCGFAFLLERAGLVIALVALLVLGMAASRHNRPDLTSAVTIALLVAFCGLVFVQGLGVPMPYLGSWWH